MAQHLRNRLTHKVAYFRELHQQMRGAPILVYSMGKVGSSALWDALPLATGRPVLHLHNTRRAEVEFRMKWNEERGYSEHPDVWHRGEYFRYRQAIDRRNRPWDVVTGVREPIARWISAFFELGPSYGYFRRGDEPGAVDCSRLTALLVDEFIPLMARDWFETEFAPTTGVDVYAEPFAVSEGYARYASPRYRVLLLRFEDIPAVAPTALAEFFDLPGPVELPEKNAASQKWYSPLYQRFVAEVVLPDRTIESAYRSRMARHFYSDQELDRFRSRWSRG